MGFSIAYLLITNYKCSDDFLQVAHHPSTSLNSNLISHSIIDLFLLARLQKNPYKYKQFNI